jgi:hypothetical protein
MADRKLFVHRCVVLVRTPTMTPQIWHFSWNCICNFVKIKFRIVGSQFDADVVITKHQRTPSLFLNFTFTLSFLWSRRSSFLQTHWRFFFCVAQEIEASPKPVATLMKIFTNFYFFLQTSKLTWLFSSSYRQSRRFEINLSHDFLNVQICL